MSKWSKHRALPVVRNGRQQDSKQAGVPAQGGVQPVAVALPACQAAPSRPATQQATHRASWTPWPGWSAPSAG